MCSTVCNLGFHYLCTQTIIIIAKPIHRKKTTGMSVKFIDLYILTGAITKHLTESIPENTSETINTLYKDKVIDLVT